MKQGTKQRIVGSVVLISLALIFLPMILDGEGSYQAPVTSRIPETPVLPEIAEPEPSRPVIIADSFAPEPEPEAPSTDTEAVAASQTAIEAESESAVGSETAAAAEAETEAEEAAEEESPAVAADPAFERPVPEFEASGLPRGWAVRMGSFSNATNASNLLQRLQDSGYKAYSRIRGSGPDRLTVVYVGPWLERALAEDYLEKLQEEFQLAGMVERFEMREL